MHIDITFKNLDSTEALKVHVNERTGRLKKYFHGKMTATWICYISAEDQVADLKVHGDSFDLFAQSKTPDLYRSIEEAVDRLETQLRKHKEKITNHHRES